jgi:hypothetical protein
MTGQGTRRQQVAQQRGLVHAIEQAIARGERVTTTMQRLGISYEQYRLVRDAMDEDEQ